ncbi:YcjF family protein [Alkalibacter mobilis]|uniref:YcjF family protein n=1 Tax=Alkalibacter mobilis TaxID=2787712 RepID=UPI0018A10F48|nr:YcjF family protein [Alkalibacter mobilis]MBF7096049.1 YcjF family protein [Alkalibacter mobilis]
MKKSRILSIVGIFILVMLFLSFLNDVLELGERFFNIHPYAAWVFYLFLAGFMIWGISVPVRWMLKAPVNDYAELFRDKEPERKDLQKIKASLVKDREKSMAMEVLDDSAYKGKLIEILKEREKTADDTIVQASLLTLLTTAISPNGFIDVLAIIYYNFKMIDTIVRAFGVRPSLLNILRITKNIFLTAFVVNQLEELEINEYIEEMVDSLSDVAAGKLLSKTVDSLIQGVLAAFVTLKIGYAAKAVLIDPSSTKEYGFRRSIRKKARYTLVKNVMPRSAAAVPKGFGKFLETLIGKMKTSQPDLG